jgi:hypothetical protein
MCCTGKAPTGSTACCCFKEEIADDLAMMRQQEWRRYRLFRLWLLKVLELVRLLVTPLGA